MAEDENKKETKIFALRVTANREDQVMDFVSGNAVKRNIPVYSVIRPHGMRGYIFIEAERMQDADESAKNVPYARGILPSAVPYEEIEHMLEPNRKIDVTSIKKSDIVEIIAGPFKREQAKVMRIDRTKDEVVVELLEAAVPVPITIKLDYVKTIRRESEEEEEADSSEEEL